MTDAQTSDSSKDEPPESRQPSSSTDLYDSALSLLNEQGRIIWQTFAAFLLAHGLILTALLRWLETKPNTPAVYLFPIFGLLLCIPWAAALSRSLGYYDLRSAQLRSAEPKDWDLFGGKGQAFSKGAAVHIGDSVEPNRMPRLARVLRTKITMWILFVLFSLMYVWLAWQFYQPSVECAPMQRAPSPSTAPSPATGGVVSATPVPSNLPPVMSVPSSQTRRQPEPECALTCGTDIEYGKCSATCTRCDGLTVHVRHEPFIAKDHRVERRVMGPPNDPWKAVALIDGLPVIGTDHDMPARQIVEFWVQNGLHHVDLDVRSMFNGVNALFCHKVEGGFEISGAFSDAAGSYSASWMVIGEGSIRTLLQETSD